MPADPLLLAAARELEEFKARNANSPTALGGIAREVSAAIPESTHALELQDLEELTSSGLESTMDLGYRAPKFPVATCGRFEALKKDPFWCSMLFFAHWKGIVLDSDTLDAHVRWMRDIIEYLRQGQLLPPEYTSERATTRVITALARQHRFRQHMRRLRAASAWDFPDLLPDVVAYVCFNHDRNPYDRRSRYRIAVPSDDEPLEPGPSTPAVERAPTPAADSSDSDPPLFKARLHKAALENLGDDKSGSKWDPVVGHTFGASLKLKCAGAAAPERRLGVLQAILRLIKEQRCVETPYFDGMSETRLREVLEKDAGFTAVMDELQRTADGDGTGFAPTLRRIVNHLCQPRKRVLNRSRRVRFAPF